MSQEFPEEAYRQLVDKVHRPVFLEKLARDYGIVPADEDEVNQLMDIAGTLRQVEAAEAQPAAGTSLINEAGDILKSAAENRGHPQPPLSRERLIYKTAADALSRDPELVEAALKFGEFVVSS